MRTCFLFILLSASLCAQNSGTIRFAVIGDFGMAGQPEQDVANLVKSWHPDFVITTGDNNYDGGAASTIDQNIGQYYYKFISPYSGSFGLGDTVNRFFPCLGNHDWVAAGAIPYLDYFTLPGNERYYDFVRGPVHFFVIDSDDHEPDGNSATSIQADWLHTKLAASTSPWKIVYFHHPPYSSSSVHGSTAVMQWPFRPWGATAVLSGHDHTYERLMRDSLLYLVNGLGGKSIYSFVSLLPESQFHYDSDYGAMLVTAGSDSICFQFFSRTDSLIDQAVIYAAPIPIIRNSPADQFFLYQNYPNPFNQQTRIFFRMRTGGHVKVTLHNTLGEAVATIINKYMDAGWHDTYFSPNGLSSGVYFYRMEAGNFSQTRKMILVK
jgi:tartrate-resistant acid phosphatase type 5